MVMCAAHDMSSSSNRTAVLPIKLPLQKPCLGIGCTLYKAESYLHMSFLQSAKAAMRCTAACTAKQVCSYCGKMLNIQTQPYPPIWQG